MKCLRALQTQATWETRLVGKDVPPLQSVKLTDMCQPLKPISLSTYKALHIYYTILLLAEYDMCSRLCLFICIYTTRTAAQTRNLMISLKISTSSRRACFRLIACEVWSRHFQLKLCISDRPFNHCKSLFCDIVAHYAIMTSLYVWNLILAYI